MKRATFYSFKLIITNLQQYRQSLAHQPRLQRSSSGGPFAMQTEATSDLLGASVLTNIPSSATSVFTSNHEYRLLLSIADKVKFWDVFVENIHPLTKIVHAPSMRQLIIEEASSVPKNNTSSNKTDALLYAICACAISSLAAAECERVFKDNQLELLNTFQSSTRNVLFNACLLKVPDIDLLRAHVLLLVRCDFKTVLQLAANQKSRHQCCTIRKLIHYGL